MWLRVFAVFLLCFCSFGYLRGFSKLRTKRQDDESANAAIEFFSNCTCVRYYQCDLENFIITDGKGLIDPRLGQKAAKRIKCPSGEYDGEIVCCKHRPGEEDKKPVTTVTPPDISPHLVTPKTVVNKTCGKQLPNINVRIFNDEDELTPVNGEFPWLAAIYKKMSGSSQWSFHASGSLIHPNVILTANHVVVSAKAADLKVIVHGRIALSQVGDNPVHERNVKEIIKHPDYSSGILINDVALLILVEPYNIETTSLVNTLCLKSDMPAENTRCLVAGWGKTPNTDGTVKTLKKVELPVLEHARCQDLLGRALDRSDFIFDDSLMCAGGEEGKDACKGDGGSPLMCPTTGSINTMYQVGIVAWGVGCGKKDVPGVYANVGFLHNWIVEQLKRKNIDYKE